jgi:hypothetical protein
MELPFDHQTFLTLRGRRFGSSNPERVDNSYWEFMVRSGEGPFSVRTAFGDHREFACGMEADPDWCFQRFGTTRTALPNGKVLYVGGEHEDWYDPDFCIYNDVIVVEPEGGQQFVSLTEGRVEMYSYPREVFPPTDFHSATLVDEWVYLIGSLGYPEDRREGVTPVFRLNTSTYRIERVSTTGTSPGWIHKHHASYDPALHAISIRGGMRESASGNLVRQQGHFCLHLAEHRWERVRAREASRTYTLCVKRRHKNAEFELPAVEELCADVPGGRFLPQGWSGSPRSPALPAVEVDGVRIDFDEWVDEYRLQCFGELPASRLAEVFAAIVKRADACTRIAWDIRPGNRAGHDEGIGG